MTPILYSSDEIDFLNNGLGQLVDLYDVDIHEQRNGLLNLTAYYPVNGQHYADISEGNIILAKPSPLDDNHAFRIVSVALDITGYAVMIEADSITYDLTNNLSKTIHMLGDGQAAMTAIQNSTLHPHIFTFYSDIKHTSESQLRYVNPMEAIAGTQGSFLQIWGGELKRENRRVAMFNRRGRDNVATFRLGKNIAGLKYTVDVSNLTTEIIPTVTVNSTDVSRTIEGETVQSSRMGNYPLVYSKMVDVSQDVKVDEGDTDDQIKAKINAFAVDWFVKSANTGKDLPEVTVEVEVESLQDSADYADKFAKLETIGLTDTVTVYVPEFGVNVTAIVNELHYDPVAERVTKLSIGTAKTSWADSNKNALNDLQDKVTEVKEQATQAVISANGKNSISSGRNAPAHPQEGDTWFWDDGTDSGIRVFTNSKWVDSTDTKTLERINNAVDGAVNEAQEYADSLSATQSEATSSVAHKLSEAAEELTRNQQNIASQASAYTDSAVAEANAKAVQIGQTTAQNAQNALNEAKKDFTSSFASQASQTASMASEANSKAIQYASQAKSEAVSAATSADGVVRTEFKSTTDSMTATIQKNKSDADGKISTAQTTVTQALDGLATKVSQTEYNTKTGQLQTDLTATTQTANQAKTDIVSIKQKDGEQDEKMNSIVSDVNGTKQTVSDLQTIQGKQSGDISTLQQRADGFDATVTKVNNLSVGGRNLLQGTGTASGDIADGLVTFVKGAFNGYDAVKTNTAWEGRFINLKSALGRTNAKAGDWYTISVYVKADKQIDTGGLDVYRALGNGDADTNDGALDGIQMQDKPIGTQWQQYAWSFQINNISLQRQSTRVEYNSATDDNWIYWAGWKLERGNLATEWTPAPEDLSSATAKAQLTADQATVSINNYKTDANGRIAKAQADITANATDITQKVSQTDYNAKTGELTTSVSKAQQTADTATQTVGAYKETNDKRVTAAETNIQANADAIKSTVSKTDFDKATGKLSGDISTLQQSAKGFEATVAKVNNLVGGGVNLLQGTGTASGDVSGGDGVLVKGAFNGYDAVRTNTAWEGRFINLYQALGRTNAKAGDWYTISVYVKADKQIDTGGLDVYRALGNGDADTNDGALDGIQMQDKPIGTQWQQYAWSFQINNISLQRQGTRVEYCYDTGDNWIYWAGWALEKGTVAHGWSPAPEDVDTQLAQVKLTADGVHTVVSDPTTGLSTRVQKAEGALSTVTGTDIPALKNATFWQPYSSLNFNDYTKQGSFFFNTTAAKTNGPTSSNSWIYLMVEQGTSGNDRIKQTAWYDGVDGVRITYARTLNSGTWSPWYANDNDSVTTISQTNSNIQQEISDRKTGDSNMLQASKDFTTSKIQSYDTGMQSRLSQTSNAILAKVGATNLFPNSEFDADYGYRFKDGKTVLSLATKNNIDGAYNGTVSVTSTGASYQGYWTNNIQVQGGQKYSASVKVHYTNGGLTNGSASLDLWFVDSKGARISSASAYTSQVSSPYWVRLVSEGLTAPTNAVYLQMSLLVNDAGAGQVATFTQPILTATEKLQQYTPNNDLSTQLSLLKDNWKIGIADNIGLITSGIIGDSNSINLISKNVTIDSPNTQIKGTAWITNAMLGNASVSTAQIADASITSAKIVNLDVNKISGEVANFIRAYWDGQYGSTSITSEGMTVSAGVTTTVFDENGMQLNKSNRSVGRIGVNDLYQDNSKKGLYFGLEATGDFMAWGAQNYAGNPYTTKLSWFRAGAVPSNLPGLIEGFNFEDNVAFINPVEMRGGIKLQGANDRLLVRASNLNGGSYPTFGGPSAYFVYAGSDIYLSSNGTAINLTKIAKAFGGIRTAAIPTGFNSNGTATGWYNVNMG